MPYVANNSCIGYLPFTSMSFSESAMELKPFSLMKLSLTFPARLSTPATSPRSCQCDSRLLGFGFGLRSLFVDFFTLLSVLLEESLLRLSDRQQQ